MLDKNAIEKIESLVLGNAEVKQIDGQSYVHKDVTRVSGPKLGSLDIGNLTSLVGLSQILGLKKEDWFFHVTSSSIVKLRSIGVDKTKQRECIATSDVSRLKESFKFGSEYSQENFIVALQSCFVQDENLYRLIDTIAKVSVQDHSDVEDDGISQTVSGKAGVVLKERMTLPNPIVLKPFKTFPEIEPVAEKFILRVTRNRHEGVSFKLVEEKSYAWELNAMASIKEWLSNNSVLPVV